MPTFIMLTRLSPEAMKSPKSLEELEHEVMNHVRSQCPGVEWAHNFAVLGAYDYLDIFHAPDTETAFKLSALIRTFGHAYTEVWPATEWARFKDLDSSFAGGLSPNCQSKDIRQV